MESDGEVLSSIEQPECLQEEKMDEDKPAIAATLSELNSKINYNEAASYWENVPPTVDGMLGGYGSISKTDITGSNDFIKSLFALKRGSPGRKRCVDCGAGIGRITKLLLQRHFGTVDLVEQDLQFAQKARETFEGNAKIGEVFCMGLQDFAPKKPVYDVIWIQWVIIYLPDKDLVAFFKRMGNSLRENGLIVIKDNFTTGSVNDSTQVIYDTEDSSITRPLEHILDLAEEAGLVLVKSKLQHKFPKHLFKVYMLAFRPKEYVIE